VSPDWIDVSRILDERTPVWPCDRPFTLCTRLEDRMTVTHLATTCHVGTHVETGLHVVAGLPALDSVPLTVLCGPAEVVHPATGGPVVRVEDLPRGWSPAAPRVLIRTGTFPAGTSSIGSGFAGLSPALVDHLAARGVLLVGIDTPSVDPMEAEDLPAHRALARHGLVWIEGLDLEVAGPGTYEMVALPLPLAGTEAAPARVLLRCARLGS